MSIINWRFTNILLVVLALTMLTGCARAGATTTAADWATASWPMEGYGPERNRATNEALTLPLNAIGQFALASSAESASPVAIAGGLLFADTKQKLHAMTLADGREQWQVNLIGSYFSPAVVGDVVFVRVESGEDGSVVALRADTGARIWQHQFARVGSSYDNIGGHVTSPVVVDNLVLVGAGEALYALDAGTGEVIWSFESEFPVVSSASIADGLVYFSDFTRLYAIDLKSGEEHWRFDHGEVTLFFAPILFGDQVALASNDTIFALDQVSGAQRWSKHFPDIQVIPAGASQHHLYVKATNQLWALNPQDGTVAWNYATTNYVSLPAITSDQLYVITRADGGSQIRALQQRDGKEVWRQDQAGLLNAAPVIAGGRVYVRTIDGNVWVFQ